MTYYIAVENGTANHYKAAVIGWPNCVAEGKTREEAIDQVTLAFTKRLNQVEIVPIEVESPGMEMASSNGGHPWAKFAGIYRNNPLIDEVVDSIQAYRHSLDQDENVI